MLKFVRIDNDNCRVYYKSGSGLVYCFQEDRPGVFTLYLCSRDGEPSHEMKLPDDVEGLPADDSSTAVSFRLWRVA